MSVGQSSPKAWSVCSERSLPRRLSTAVELNRPMDSIIRFTDNNMINPLRSYFTAFTTTTNPLVTTQPSKCTCYCETVFFDCFLFFFFKRRRKSHVSMLQQQQQPAGFFICSGVRVKTRRQSDDIGAHQQ